MRILPTIKHNEKEYFVDGRLWQIRNTINPYEFIEIDDIEDDELVKKVLAVIPEETIINHY